MKVVPETMSKRMNFWVKIPTILFLFATKYARFSVSDPPLSLSVD